MRLIVRGGDLAAIVDEDALPGLGNNLSQMQPFCHHGNDSRV